MEGKRELDSLALVGLCRGREQAEPEAAGVAVVESADGTTRATGVQIRLNSFRQNGGLGIDLGSGGLPDGLTPNDEGDLDEGANELQNHPMLESARLGEMTRLTGRLDSVAGSEYQIEPKTFSRSAYWGFYFQDDWKITSRLTLNFGLRYDFDVPRWERENRYSYWDLEAQSPVRAPGLDTRGVMKFNDDDRRSPFDSDMNNWQPRFGFAREGGVTPLGDGRARRAHQRAVEVQAVLGDEPRSEHFARAREVAQIGAAVALAHRTVAARIER